MLSDMLWRESLHSHSMTSGGTTATAVRTAQLGKEFNLSTMPMTNAADTQSVATMGLR